MLLFSIAFFLAAVNNKPSERGEQRQVINLSLLKSSEGRDYLGISGSGLSKIL
jgi:hypothetical protein